MSRIAKKPIAIPEKTEVIVGDGSLLVKGQLGELSKPLHRDIEIKIEDGGVIVSKRINNLFTKALIGTYASHIKNMLSGVNKLYEKRLIIEGVGFKSDVQGKTLNLALGFSHQIKIDIPDGVEVKTEKNLVTVSGIDKEKVGNFAASVRALKKPEPYKGKGIRYDDEVIRRKEGKKSV